MLIDVDDPIRDLILNGCFYVIAAAALLALVPWRSFGAGRLSRMLRWLVFPVVGLAVGYEVAMPSRYDIRVNLLLLLPMYLVVVATSVVRWVAWRRADTRAGRAV